MIKQNDSLFSGSPSETKSVQLRAIPDSNWVQGTEIMTETGCHSSHCLLEYEVGTTGYSHKYSTTYLRLSGKGCTNIRIQQDGNGVEIFLDWDDELDAIKNALRFFLRVLDRESELQDENNQEAR